MREHAKPLPVDLFAHSKRIAKPQMLVSLLVSAAAFSGPSVARPSRHSNLMMGADPTIDRRAALASAASIVAFPMVANAEVFQGGTSLGLDDGKDYNSGTEDAMAAIAAKNKAKFAREAAALKESRREKTEAEVEAEQAKSKQLILNVAAGGTLLSVPFFLPNLQRLFIKVTSAGADDGYSSIGTKPKKGAKAAKASKAGKGQLAKEENLGGKVFKAFFGRSLELD